MHWQSHFFLFLAFPLLAASPLRAENARVLSLGEAFHLVERNNARLILNEELIAQALSAARRERSTLLPAIDVEATQTRSRFAGQGGGSPLSGDFGPGGGTMTSNRFEAGLAGNVALLDPQRIANFRASRVDVEVADLTYAEVRQEIFAQVAQAFLEWQVNRQREEVFRANVERSQAFLDLANNRVEAGVAPEIDRTRAEVQLARDEQALLEQESVVFAREIQVRRLLALTLDEPLEPVLFATRLVERPSLREEILPSLYRERAEYQTLLRTLERNRIEVRAARWERFPSLNLFGNLGWVSETPLDGDETGVWGLGIGLRAPLFEGFRIRANTLLAQSRMRSTETRLRDLEEAIAAEYALVLRNLESRVAQIEVAEKNLALSSEELRLAEVRFAQGVADNRELIEAQNNVAQAGENLVVALNRYDLSRLELARIRGDVRLILADQVDPGER